MSAEIGLSVEGHVGLTWERWDRILELTERVGFQCVFRSDHLIASDNPDLEALELWGSLTYAAVKTKKIEFGPLVSPITFRHPMVALRQAVEVDDLSRGRLVFGLGAGWQARAHEVYGIPFPDRKTRFDWLAETLEITQRLLVDDAPVTYTGSHISVRDMVLRPIPKRKTPILIGGNGLLRTLPLVARFADEWNAIYLDVDAFIERNRRLDDLLEAEGRDPGSVKRSMMCSFGLESDEIDRYVEAGCQRLMMKFRDFENLDLLEEWADENLHRWHC